MKRFLVMIPVLCLVASAAFAGPNEKERTPAQKAVLTLCIKRCNDNYTNCEKGASMLKKAACANTLRVCTNDCEKKH